MLPAGHDFVVVARPGIEDLIDREGVEGLAASLRELLTDGEGDRGAEPGESQEERST